MFKAIIFIFLSCCPLFKKTPSFKVIELQQCPHMQGRKEMGTAFKYKITLVATGKSKNLEFPYLLINNQYVPAPPNRSYPSLKKGDTLQLDYIRFTERTYQVPYFDGSDTITSPQVLILKTGTGKWKQLPLGNFNQNNCKQQFIP